MKRLRKPNLTIPKGKMPDGTVLPTVTPAAPMPAPKVNNIARKLPKIKVKKPK